ncbi:MAG: sulfatase-like hydrolase/transferase, partial [Nitrososphaeraceae archaeon]
MGYTKRHLHILSIFTSILILSFSITTSEVVYAQESETNNAKGEKPNILLIVGDDFGFSDVGSFGSEISTPYLDTLASEGKILTNYHTYPTCSPARASLLTGVDNHLAGIGTMHEAIAPNQVGQPGYETYINDNVVTVAELLRDSGYHTLLSGKWHLSGKDYQNGTTPYDRGFEETFTLLEGAAQHFNGGSGAAGHSATFLQNGQQIQRPDNLTYSNDLYTNMLIDQINKYKDDGQPLFMYLSFQVAHSPFQAPSEYIQKYDGVYDIGYDKIREDRFEKQKELGIWSSDMQLPERIPANPA